MTRKEQTTQSHSATRSVRAGLESDAQHGSVVPPIYLSSNFAFEGYRKPRKYDYTRSGNPTRDQLGAALADLEGGAGAVVTCTGLAAITLILATLPQGARVLAPHDCYGGTLSAAGGAARARQARGRLRRSRRCARRCEAALAAKPKLVWIETPSNPLLRIVDIRAVADAAHAAGALVAVGQHLPLAALAAAAGARRRSRHAFDHQVLERPQRRGRRRGHRRDAGARRESRLVGQRHRRHGRAVRQLPLRLRGVRTLHARMRVHAENTAAVVELLAAVTRRCAGLLPGPPRSSRATRSRAASRASFGAMLSFELAGGEAAVAAFLERPRVLHARRIARAASRA